MSETALDLALARAVLYRALGRGLRRPAPEEVGSFFSAEARAPLVGAAAVLDLGQRPDELVAPAVAACLARGTEPGARDAEAHDRLFGHSRGLVCPFETEYGSEGAFEQPQALADLAGTYRAFGLAAAASRDERVDHVACECEFMEFLARKEVFALAQHLDNSGEGPARATVPEAVEVTRAAARGFLREHLGRFGRAFASRLIREDVAGFHAGLGRVLFPFLAQECRRFGLPAGPPVLELRPPAEDPTPMACGSAGGACGAREELIQVQRRPPA